MGGQLSWLEDNWETQYQTCLQELIMVTSIARQRVTIAHIMREIVKEKSRYARLKQPMLKKNSGVRVTMLKERLETNQNILRELLVEKGYLANTDANSF